MHALFTLIVATMLLLTVTPLRAQTDGERAEPEPEPKRKRPSFTIGDALRVDLRTKLQVDWRDFGPERAIAPEPAFDLRRARVGISGTFVKRIDYELERDLREGIEEPWRDAYIKVDAPGALNVQAGRFKMPFSADRLTGSTDLDFLSRSLAATYLAPGRDLGVMVQGRVFGRIARYEAGLFRHGGDEIQKLTGAGGATVASRLTVKPWNGRRTAQSLRGLTLGAAFTSGTVPEGSNRLMARTFSDDALFAVYVRGRRQRVGGEVEWRTGPVSVRSEVMRVTDQRRGQAIDDSDLSDVAARGWYLSGTWLVTGEKKSDDIQPTRPLLQGGFGALEVAGRIEDLGLTESGDGQLPSRSPRAISVLEQSERALTFGINWYANRFIKVQANVIREQLARGMAPTDGQDDRWHRVLRFQFAF